jgi:hypothetical protein
VRSFEYDADWLGRASDIALTFTNSDHLANRGITLTAARGLDPPLCEEFAASAVPGP